MSRLDFASQIGGFGEEVKSRSNQILIASALHLHKSIRVGDELTGSTGAPKKTGYLQNSIQIGRGEEISFAQSGLGPNPEGTNIPAGSTGAEIAGTKVGEVIIIATNTVYAEKQEHMHKTKANHWAMSAAGWPRIVRKYVDQILGAP